MTRRLFRTVLVPHDFSEPATAALRVAADLAAAERGRLIVLHVLGPFYTGPAFPPPGAIAWSPPRELVADLQVRLQSLVARTLGPTRARRAECRAVMGDPVRRILAATREADVIVMATRGLTGVSHLLLGSVAERIVRQSPIPVLTVREGTRTMRRRRRASTARSRRSARRSR